MSNIKHYNKEYFSWQKKIGLFGAEANKFKFEKYVFDGQNVLDFGCGGGYLLSRFSNIQKFGVEVNETAANEARNNGLKVFKSTKDLPSNFFDLIISNSALEHCDNPYLELTELYRALKKNSKICITVPCDNKKNKFLKNDPHMHLYSWSPSNLGNILVACGFNVIESKPFLYKWFPRRYFLKKFMSWSMFHFLCKIWARIDNNWYQIRAIAKK